MAFRVTIGRTAIGMIVVLGAILAIAIQQAPSVAAGGLLHPGRRPVTTAPPEGCQRAEFAGDGVTLAGWRCTAASARLGTVVFLHGVADNHTSAAGMVARFRPRGFDVVAYDSRAHGHSSGDACTYGYYERRDLLRVLDTTAPGPIVLIGTSLGSAVALQAAPGDDRIAAIVAAEAFSDLRTIAAERAPWFLPGFVVRSALGVAEARGNFSVADVSPLEAARRITVPVLLVHGEEDHETPPSHSERIYDALAGRKRLLLVPGAGHNQSLQPAVWTEIDSWIDDALR